MLFLNFFMERGFYRNFYRTILYCARLEDCIEICPVSL